MKPGIKDVAKVAGVSPTTVSMSEELKNIEIYYDNTFIEIYLNDGKDTMTLRAFPENVEINLI